MKSGNHKIESMHDASCTIQARFMFYTFSELIKINLNIIMYLKFDLFNRQHGRVIRRGRF